MSLPGRQRQRIGEIIVAFLKLGLTAFGGPATAVAMMRQEFVLKRKWLSEEEFLDFWGISNLIPGPNATELAMHIGMRYAGWAGLVAAGVFYIIPAMLIVLGFAWAYVRFGTLPALDGILAGIKPVVVAILLAALGGMLRPRLKQTAGLALAAGVLVAYLAGVGPLPLLLAGGALFGFLRYLQEKRHQHPPLGAWVPWLLLWGRGWQSQTAFSLWRLFRVFFKAGALMYGSGYVLLAFIQDDLVERLGWLSQAQLVDAIAVGQVTPGPLATTATFVGYLMGGIPAALLATLAMFLPGFLFAAVTHPLLAKLRESGRARGFLDGVVFAALGLMAGVTWEVGAAALVSPLAVGAALVALFLLLRYKVPAPWLILGGAVVGVVQGMLGG